MDVSALVSEAVQEAVQAASQLNLCTRETIEHEAGGRVFPDNGYMEQCEHSTLPSLDGKSDKENTRNPSAPGCGTELEVPGQPAASVRLHKAKIRALQRELHASRTALEARNSEIKELRQEFFDVKAAKITSFRTVSGLEQQVNKLQKQVEESRAQVAAQDALLRQHKEDRSSGARHRLRAEAESQAQNARLNRALDEVQRFRKQLEDAKQRAAVQDSVTQSEHARVLAENKKLERQKSELLAAFKKQGKLVNVLKKQKLHMETARLLQFTEDEFVAALR